MWKSVSQILASTIKHHNKNQLLLTPEKILHQQLRTTFILKRRVAPFYHKKGMPPRKLRTRHYIYDLVKDDSIEPQSNIDVILTSFVDGLGNVGDRVNVKPNFAYNKLLLPGLAVYATPEYEDKYKDHQKLEDVVQYSSPYASLTMSSLQRKVIAIMMNKENAWTLQPWHVRVAFRKCGIIVPEAAIKMPDKTISGPDLNLEYKLFLVAVTINKTETVNVRCHIHHWSTNLSEKLPYTPEFWLLPYEPLFPEDAPIINDLIEQSKKPNAT